MATIEAVELPTEAEYAEVARTIEAAHDAVEGLAWRLSRLTGGVELEPSKENPKSLLPRTVDPAYPTRWPHL